MRDRGPDGAGARRRRADAQRNVDALLEAARAVFDTSGVDAPAKEITDLAGVGVGTLYRHFPQRSDLVKAVVEWTSGWFISQSNSMRTLKSWVVMAHMVQLLYTPCPQWATGGRLVSPTAPVRR